MPVRLFSRRVANIYSDPNTGSGVEFQGVESRYQAVLEECLLEAKDINKLDEHQKWVNTGMIEPK